MAGKIDQRVRALWALARQQHWVVSRWQLLDLGFSRHWIDHRIAAGCLDPLWRGVYAVGRPHVTPYAVDGRGVGLRTCSAVLSHDSAATLWGFRPAANRCIAVRSTASRSKQRSTRRTSSSCVIWSDLGLVVQTDSLRFHRTPAQQARDRLRDQAHAAAGLTPLRFTHAQVRFEPGYVGETVAAVARRLGA